MLPRLLCLLTLSAAGCVKQPDTLPLPTRICLRTQHHGIPIPAATVRIKFNADTFPGYGKEASYFDAVFSTGADASGCLEPVPEGTHWLVATGYDSLHLPHEVRGSLRVHIDLKTQPKIDTILYVSE